MGWVEQLDRPRGWVSVLAPLGWLFGCVSHLRRWLYDRDVLPSARVDVPVICVGNVIAGGTGKTPVVVALAKRLQAQGHRVGVLSRGYGKAGAQGAESDEAKLYAELLPDLPRMAQPDRIDGARRLIEQGADVVLMDDGFQHRRLQRDLDLVLIDAMRPWGLAQGPRAFLPRGLMREGPAALARAAALVLTRCDHVAPAALATLEAELERVAPGVPRILCAHRAKGLRRLSPATQSSSSSSLGPSNSTLEPPEQRPLADLHGLSIDSVSAIGAPAGFEATLRQSGATLVESRRFADHHEFQPADLSGLGARPIVVTAKDAVKLRATLPPDLKVYVLDIEIEWLRGLELLDTLLGQLPVGRARRERDALHEGLHG